MNELEARGYRVTDLNKDGLSANADLIAAKGGKIWQKQEKGSTNTMAKPWWIQYGYSTPEIIAGKIKMFNRLFRSARKGGREGGAALIRPKLPPTATKWKEEKAG